MIRRYVVSGIAVVVTFVALAFPTQAGITVMEKGDSYLDMGILLDIQGRDIQNQQPSVGIGNGVFFRRLRPFLYGAMNKDWQGIIQMEFGNGFEGQDAKPSIKWAYMEYLGFEANQQTSLKIGSFKPPFSREFLTLGPRLQQTERTVGMQWYGTPDYMIGIGLNRMTPDRKVQYAIAGGSMSINPRADRMFMQMPLNNTSSDNNEGWMAAGRLDYYPWGEMPFDPKPLASENAYNRGDFNHTQYWRLMLSGAAYAWWNNNQNNLSNNTGNPDGNGTLSTNQDVRSTYGFEGSAGLRGFGFSGDIEYQYVHGKLLNQNFTGGLYQNGTTGLHKFAVNGGYMVYKDEWEPTVTFSILDASNYASVWTQTTIGVNWFIHHYDIRVTANYAFNNNVSGVPGQWENAARIQTQFAW
jgi:phosphate-selective porin OprO/OprP